MARRPPPKKKRVRRTAEDAQNAILDAAEQRLLSAGPGSVRIADVARDVGVSHPTVLHHFGSREALLAAVVDRCVTALHEELVEAIAGSTPGDDAASALLERTSTVLNDKGYGRVAAWLLLSGYPPDHRARVNFDAVVRAAHELRRARHAAMGRKKLPPLEDTRFVLMLAALALFGEAIVGPLLRADDAKAEGLAFRRWLAQLITRHLEAPAP